MFILIHKNCFRQFEVDTVHANKGSSAFYCLTNILESFSFLDVYNAFKFILYQITENLKLH